MGLAKEIEFYPTMNCDIGEEESIPQLLDEDEDSNI